MKPIKIFFLLLCLILPVTSMCAQLVLDTEIGTINLPSDQEINQKIAAVKNDKSLGEQEKNDLLQNYAQALTTISQIDDLQQSKNELEDKLKNSDNKLKSLSNEYVKAERQSSSEIKISSQSSLSVANLSNKIKDELSKAQDLLLKSNDNLSSVQTLPEKAQATITADNQEAKNVLNSIVNASDPDDFNVRIKALKVYFLNLETELLQEQLNSLSVLQDMASYEVKIATFKFNYLSNYLKAVNAKEQELSLQNGERQENYSQKKAQDFSKIPSLAAIIKNNQSLIGYISDHRQKNLDLNQEIHEVSSAVTVISQIEKNLSSQLNELDKSLVLSRLLNKQLSLIPKISISENLDETIPDLNIWIYELREYIDKLFDIEKAVSGVIGKNKDLEQYRSEITVLMSERKRLLNQLYQELANEVSNSIQLKLEYQEFENHRVKVTDNINEQLFWIKSNMPLTAEFILNIPSALQYSLAQSKERLQSKEFWKNTEFTAYAVLLPMLILTLIIEIFKQRVVNWNNRLAQRLDRKNDGLLVTPLAILNRIVCILPKQTLYTIIGGAVICLALTDSASQYKVILIMTLHIFAFIFFIDILSPNSLAQRHFCIPPRILNENRIVLNSVWRYTIPILIFANIAEIDSVNIYNDIFGYLVVLISDIGLLFATSRWLKKRLTRNESLSVGGWCLIAAAMLVPLFILLMLVTGYYYTLVKLVNRLAYTLYVGIGYYLVSQTVLRMLYVYGNKLLHAAINNKRKNSPEEASADAFQLIGIKFDFIGIKAFKLINSLLICLTLFLMYMQWDDLAGVLSYLNTIKISTTKEMVNGLPVVTSTLTLANVLLAVFILVIAWFVNKNLPVVLERIFLFRSSSSQDKSTSYTVRIISSYIIIALGIILSAGAIGIKWENLQWLVAALSVGLGFGLQEIFANFVSGLIILFERQIRVGDIITLNAMSGTVKKIRIRSTTILSFENKEVMIPNRQFITSALTNWSLSDTVTMLEFKVGVAYDANVDKAKSLLARIIGRCPYISKEKGPLIYVSTLADSTVGITAEVYVGAIGNRKMTFDYLNRETLRVFAENGIDIPFNQLDINIKSPVNINAKTFETNAQKASKVDEA